MSRPAVTIVTVTYNSRRVLVDLVSSLQEACSGLTDWELIAVDNASEDDGPDLLASLFEEATVVRRTVNGGFAAGVNEGLQRVGPERAVLLLNPDARLHPDSMDALLDALDGDVGIVAPRLLEEDGATYPSIRRDPTVLRVLGAAVLGDRDAGRFSRLGEVITNAGAYDRAQDVAWAGGAVLMLAPGLVQAIGLLDESFFLYSEETDYALRARASGYRVRYEPRARATHIGGDSTTSPDLYRLMIANKVRLFAKRNPRRRAARYRYAMLFHQWVRSKRGRPLAGHGIDALRDRSLLDG